MSNAKKQSGAKHKKRPAKKSAAKTKRLPLRRLLLVYGSLVVITGAVAAIAATTQTSSLPDPFRSEQRSAAKFQLYYPARLPEGMSVDAGSLGRAEADIVSMRISDGRGSLGRSFTITQQALPPGFNLETLFSSFADKTTFKTPLGTAAAGMIDNGSTRLVSLATKDNTLLLIQAPGDLPLADLELTLKHLKPSRTEN
jgi:hypothetical protein